MKASSPVVSILTPCFNHENYIGSCIESVKNQKYYDWEMIIINDGSTDRTIQIAESYKKTDKRIIIINQENIGIFRLAETYNTALNSSQGKYIAILEGDDLWEPDKLLRQVEVMESDHDIILSWGKAQAFTEILRAVGDPIPTLVKAQVFNNDPPGAILRTLYFENPIPAVTMLFRKDVLDSIGGFQQSFNLPLVDLPTIFSVLSRGKFYFDDYVLAKWRISSNQVTKTYPVEILLGRWSLVHHFYRVFQKNCIADNTIDLKTIDNYYQRKLLISYARSGRYKLIRKDFNGAREDYVRAIAYRGSCQLVWRLRAIIGLLFSYFKWDVEWLSHILGKVSYKIK
jgi:glycosyltransferase involved in cell wall biosynthesis